MSEFSNKELRITTREGIIKNIKKAIENKENIDWKFVKDIVDNYLIRFISETFIGNMWRILKEEILMDMCWFATIKELIKDHKLLKQYILSTYKITMKTNLRLETFCRLFWVEEKDLDVVQKQDINNAIWKLYELGYNDWVWVAQAELDEVLSKPF